MGSSVWIDVCRQRCWKTSLVSGFTRVFVHRIFTPRQCVGFEEGESAAEALEIVSHRSAPIA
jgi:hypothetical protein